MKPHHTTLPLLAGLLGLTVAALTTASCGSEDDIAASCAAKLIGGDLVITEVMSNPSGADDGQEWVELHNPTSAPINLKGVKFTMSRLDDSSSKTWRMPDLTVAAGGYVVFGNADDADLLPFMNAGYGNFLSDMLNAGAKFTIKCNSTVVDEAQVGEAIEAVALQLSSLNLDASANDKADNWCPATQEVTSPDPDAWADFKGSPGKANRPCAVAGKCMEGGEARDLNKPKTGDLLLNEVMFDPDGTESEREWIEVMVKADVDLNDLELGKFKDGVALAPAYTITDADCLKVKKGDLVLLAREPGKHLNGGIPDGAIGYDSLSMTNSKGHGVWIGMGPVLDAVSWSTSKNGHSFARDPAQADKWCAATDNEPYGWAEDLYGTPGKANPPCK